MFIERPLAICLAVMRSVSMKKYRMTRSLIMLSNLVTSPRTRYRMSSAAIHTGIVKNAILVMILSCSSLFPRAVTRYLNAAACICSVATGRTSSTETVIRS